MLAMNKKDNTSASSPIPEDPARDPEPEPEDRAREQQLRERELELKEKELQLHRESKEKELQLQQGQLTQSKWTGPVTVAVVAGIVGLMGTFFTSWQNRELERTKHETTLAQERQKQEGNLILEAIKTEGHGMDKETQTAANLVFLVDAGLINIGKEFVDKLRAKAGDTLPSLPAQTTQTTPRGEDTENFLATYRREARTSVVDAPVTTYEDLDALLKTLPKDEPMRERNPAIDRSSPRVAEENRNVTVKAYLYAYRRNAGNDIRLILGNSPDAAKRQYFGALLSGLPPSGPFRDRLRIPRDQFKKELGEPPGTGYLRLDSPILVKVTGSLYYNRQHPPETTGPTGMKSATSWEIQPITDIVFEQ
jgi:hypothetical protein